MKIVGATVWNPSQNVWPHYQMGDPIHHPTHVMTHEHMTHPCDDTLTHMTPPIA